MYIDRINFVIKSNKTNTVSALFQDFELTRKPVAFSNSMEGFNSFYNSIVELMQTSELEEALVGIEPTGHYWFDLGQFMGEKSIKFVMVNPQHVDNCFV